MYQIASRRSRVSGHKFRNAQRTTHNAQRIGSKFAGLALVLVFLTVAATGCGRKTPPINISVNAESAMIVEVETRKVLFAKNADQRLEPASTVKLMTAIVAIENKPLLSQITPTNSVKWVEPTRIDIKPGVRYYLRDLIEAILIKSANDAAVAIAEGVAGSEQEFAELMNKKAKSLGMNDTHFVTASGLPAKSKDGQYSTARDLAKLMLYAARYEFILSILSKSQSEIQGSDGKRIRLETHNKSLYSEKGCSWGKTGYTMKAKRVFTGVDPSYRPKIAFSLMKSDDLWNDISTLKNKGIEIYEEHHRNIFRKIADWFWRRT